MAKHPEPQINVRVISTAGNYPKHGHERVPVTEPIAEILKRAAHALQLADLTDWVARIDGNPVDPAQSYQALGLHGEVKVDFGKREGGGG